MDQKKSKPPNKGWTLKNFSPNKRITEKNKWNLPKEAF